MGYGDKWPYKLSPVWVQSCTQDGHMARERLRTLREGSWLSGCFTAGGCSAEGTTESKYQRKGKSRANI